MWRAVNTAEWQPAASRMEAAFGRGAAANEISSPAATGLGLAAPHSPGSSAGALLNDRTARRHFSKLTTVAAAEHKEEPLAQAEPRSPLMLGRKGSKAQP